MITKFHHSIIAVIWLAAFAAAGAYAAEPWQVYRYAPEIDRISVPALFIVGEEDQELRRIGIRRAFYALLKRGVPAETRMYPHARRAFDFRDDPREKEKLATRDAARWTAQFMREALNKQ